MDDYKMNIISYYQPVLNSMSKLVNQFVNADYTTQANLWCKINYDLVYADTYLPLRYPKDSNKYILFLPDEITVLTDWVDKNIKHMPICCKCNDKLFQIRNISDIPTDHLYELNIGYDDGWYHQKCLLRF